MAEKVGDKAMRGELEDIVAHKFDIKDNMMMTFEGASCNILDKNEQQQANFGKKDGMVTREVRHEGSPVFIERRV